MEVCYDKYQPAEADFRVAGRVFIFYLTLGSLLQSQAFFTP